MTNENLEHKIFSALVDAHKFFVEKSPSFVGRMNIKADRYIMSWKEKIYYPIAYCKFMSSCIGDVGKY